MSARNVPGKSGRDAAQSARGAVPTGDCGNEDKRNPGAAYLAGALHLIVPLAACVVLLAGSVALAQSGGNYTLSWSTADGGGGTFSTGGNYTLGGTAGQPDAGVMAGGEYTLGGGFWGGGSASDLESCLYMPVVLRSY